MSYPEADADNVQEQLDTLFRQRPMSPRARQRAKGFVVRTEDGAEMVERTIPTRRDAEELMAQGAKLLAEIKRLESKYAPEPDEGKIVAFSFRFPHPSGSRKLNVNTYRAVALRTGNRWYCTGTQMPGAASWEELLTFFEMCEISYFAVVNIDPWANEIVSPSDTVEGRVVSRD
jgi:hypothetical protein